MSDAKRISVYLMIVHQYVAFAIYSMPLSFAWEKLLRVHTKPFWIRFIARFCVGEAPEGSHQAILDLVHRQGANCFAWEKLLRVHTKPFWIWFIAREPVGCFIWFIAILAPFYGAMNALYASLATPFLGFILPCSTILWVYRTKEARDNAIVKPYNSLLVKQNYSTWGAFAECYGCPVARPTG
eukprot:gene4351-14469_t